MKKLSQLWCVTREEIERDYEQYLTGEPEGKRDFTEEGFIEYIKDNRLIEIDGLYYDITDISAGYKLD
jgi:hypothetical protein